MTSTDTSTDPDREARRLELERRVAAWQEAKAQPVTKTTEAERGHEFGMISIGDFLAKRGAVDPATAASCARCNGVGKVRGQALRWDAELGLVYPPGYWCDCPMGQARQAEQESEQQAREQAQSERQAKVRQERALQLFGQAAIPPFMAAWTFETYGLAGGNLDMLALVRDYAQQGCVNTVGQQKRSLALLGKTGVGKTGLAICCLRAKLEAGVPGLFVEWTMLLARLRQTFKHRPGEATEDEVMRSLLEVDFLVLDDVGDPLLDEEASRFTREVLYEVVNERHNHCRPFVLTSNLTAAQMEQQFHGRLWWRLAEVALVVDMPGRNLRAR